MSRETKVPSIPDVRDDNVKDVLRAIKATLEVREGAIGDPLDQGATFRDLVDLNLADLASRNNSGSRSGVVGPIIGVLPPNTNGYNPETDYTVPPAPTGFRAAGGFTNVFLEWDGAPYKNHAYTEIWRSQFDNLGTAVLIGTTAANVYADPADANTTYYYWVRFVSRAAVTGPYNSTSGTVATTAIDVTAALTAISGEIIESQLFVDLGARITAIEAQSVLTASELETLNDANRRFDVLLNANGSAIQLTNAVTAAQATQITNIGTRVSGAESSISTLQSTTAMQATQITSLTTRVGTAESNITNLQQTTANQATSISQLTTSVNGNTASIQTLTTTTDGLSAQQTVKIDNNGYITGYGLASTSVNGIPSSSFIVRSDSFAIAPSSPPEWSSTTAYLANQTVSYTSAGQTKTYQAKLASTNVLPTNTTYWNDITSILPFVVLTQATVIDGVTYPAGTYIKTAFIADATITTAKIQSLTADKITTGNLTAAVGITTGRISGGAAGYNSGTGFWLGNDGGVYKFYLGSFSQNMRWDGSSLSVTGNINAVSGSFYNVTVYDTNGAVLLSSGSGVNLAGSTIPSSNVTGLGSLATQNSVTAGQVTGLGALATQNDVFIGSNVKIWNGSSYVVLNTADFVNSLSKITSANISTFIASAAIGNAYIGNLDAAKITTGSLATNRLQIGNNSGSSRIQMFDDRIEVWNGGVLRVKIGNLA